MTMIDIELLHYSLEQTNLKLEEIRNRVGKTIPASTKEDEINLNKYSNYLNVVEYFMYSRLQQAIKKDLALINAEAGSTVLENNNGNNR